MAIGDAAAAAGLSVVSPTADIRLGYQAINLRGDELAAHKTSGTHPWANITGKPTTYTPTQSALETFLKSVFGTNVMANECVFRGTNLIAPTIRATNRLYAPRADVPVIVSSDSITAARVNVQNELRATGLFTAPSVYGTTVGTNRRSVYVDSDGLVGYVPSTIAVKESIEHADLDTDALLAADVVTYTRKGDETGIRELGLIAEQLHEAGLTDLVYYDDDGHVDGVAYERLSLYLLSALSDVTARLTALETKEK